VVLAFPIFDGFRTQGKVMQARSSYETARLDEAELRDQVTLEVRMALDAVREAQLILDALAGTVAQAERLCKWPIGWSTASRPGSTWTRPRQPDQARANRASAQHDYLVALTSSSGCRGCWGGCSRGPEG